MTTTTPTKILSSDAKSRRAMISELVYLSSGLVLLTSYGCRVASSSTKDELIEPKLEKIVVIKDLRAIALYSDGNFGPDTGTILSADLAAKKSVIHKYWDSHGHTYSLTEAHYLDLLKGKKIQVVTTVAQGHDHKVLIDPAKPIKDAKEVSINLYEYELPADLP
jgi:hypothetical protein